MSSFYPQADEYADVEGPQITVEKLPWDRFRERFARRFHQGDYVSIFGGPNAGKTHLAVLVAEHRALSFFLALKPRDTLIGRLASRGWTISSSLEAMNQLVERKRERDGVTVKEEWPLYPRYVYWPLAVPSMDFTLDQIADIKSRAAEESMVLLLNHGSWAVVWDEANYMADTLRLRRQMSEFWYSARSNLVSVIACAQRPAYIPRVAYTSPHHLFIFQATEREDQKRLAEIVGGMEWQALAAAIGSLNWRGHEFLYVAPHDRTAFISACPPW